MSWLVFAPPLADMHLPAPPSEWGPVPDAHLFESRDEFMAAVLRSVRKEVTVALIVMYESEHADVARFASMMMCADPNVVVVLKLPELDDPGLVWTASEELTCDLGPHLASVHGSKLHLDPAALKKIHTQIGRAQEWRKERPAYRYNGLRSGKWPPLLPTPFSWIFSSEILRLSDFSTTARVAELKLDVRRFRSFDPHEYTSEDLVTCVFIMIKDVLSPVSRASVSDNALLWLILVVRGCYPSNLYHNFRHAVDVVQAVYYYIYTDVTYPSKKPLSPEDRLALVLAALGHDVFHPGVTYQTMTQSLSEFADVNKSLESYHSYIFHGLLAQLWPVVAENSARETVDSAIAATEMVRHSEYVRAADDSTRSGQLLFLAQILKIADVANVARNFQTSIDHAIDLAQEFIEEVRVKELLKLDNVNRFAIPEIRDRSNWRELAKMQLSFVDRMVEPLFRQVAEANPQFADLLDWLGDSSTQWKNNVVDEAMAREERA